VRQTVTAVALAALAGPLAGCALPPLETPAEAQARQGQSCKEAGFTEGSENFRLCLLLQQTNERLAGVERRLGILEQQTAFPPGPGFYRRPYWW
jgi:hypothetical protein